MEKIKALKTFLDTEAKKASADFAGEAMSYLTAAKKRETLQTFVESIDQALIQNPSLSFLQIVLLRAPALKGQPFYRLEAYGEEFYLSEPLGTSWLAVDWLYQAYRAYTCALDEGSRKFVFQIGKMELDRMKLAELWNCQKIIKHVFTESLGYMLESPAYQRLDASKSVQFHLGEYKGAYEVLLTKNEMMDQIGGVIHGVLCD